MPIYNQINNNYIMTSVNNILGQTVTVAVVVIVTVLVIVLVMVVTITERE